MESLEQEVLAVLRQQPERNPDGTTWKMHVGVRSYTKAYLLKNWETNDVMRHDVVKAILSLKVHLLGRGPLE